MTNMLNNVIDFFRVIYRFFADADCHTWVAIGFTLAIGLLSFRIFFPKKNGSSDVSADYTTWQNYDLLKLKGLMYLMVSVGTGAIAYHLLRDWFPHTLSK